MMTQQLRSAGYQVIEAEDGHNGLAAAQKQRPDLIILDLSMPDLDGLAVLKKLRDDPVTAEIPVIVCSARGYKDDILRAKQRGATDFIVKPVSPNTLLEKVSRLCPPPEQPSQESAEDPSGEQ